LDAPLPPIDPAQRQKDDQFVDEVMGRSGGRKPAPLPDDRQLPALEPISESPRPRVKIRHSNSGEAAGE
jgi:hypothetical protein